VGLIRVQANVIHQGPAFSALPIACGLVTLRLNPHHSALFQKGGADFGTVATFHIREDNRWFSCMMGIFEMSIHLAIHLLRSWPGFSSSSEAGQSSREGVLE